MNAEGTKLLFLEILTEQAPPLSTKKILGIEPPYTVLVV